MDNITTISFYELEKKVYSLVCSLGCEILKIILENQDKTLMEQRNKKEYRHKGYRNNTIKTVMGEVEYKRAIYLKGNKHTYLLDSNLQIDTYGKISTNLAEIMLNTVVNTVSYRKGASEIKSMTNETISHQALSDLVWIIGKKIEEKENEEIRLLKEEKLVKGKKTTQALFEEADGIWVNLQGRDRKQQIEKYKNKCERQNREYKAPHFVKTELKLHVMYEGWNKNSNRHELINKSYIAGMMSSKTLEKIRNARIYQRYNEEDIKLRAINGDGARWIKNIATKDTISQKDSFHIQQEIMRDIPEEKYRNELIQIITDKRYNEVQDYIEGLKYKLGGEEKIVNKLKKLQNYLRDGLPRYQDVLKKQGRELPTAPDGIEYRDMGTMESQVFSVLKVRLMSGRKSFLKDGASYLSKVCAMYYEKNGEIKLQKIESEIPIDDSVENWIKEIEENVRKNRIRNQSNRKEIEINNYAHSTVIKDLPQVKELVKLLEPTALIYR